MKLTSRLTGMLLLSTACTGAWARGHAPPRATPHRIVIPAIASLAGVRVGYDTIESMERLYGPGYAYTGGHPHGAREWVTNRPACYIDADGFNYNGRGHRILDQISIGGTGIIASPAVPIIGVRRRQLLFMRTVALGMTKPQVLATLRHKRIRPTMQGDKWILKATGYAPIYPRPWNDKHHWEADLWFRQDRLQSIEVDADE